ncbi:nitronate monooxygenase [Streptomyces sp. NPDC086989]|uniref:nitronate monooxygenase n=1 Tax=Streptomyces sp. NPDC086989 TaxID=3365764 RepID=UPI00380B4E97
MVPCASSSWRPVPRSHHRPLLPLEPARDSGAVAAALALGAQGVLMGTRFLASQEMSVSQAWKDRIVASDAADTVKAVGSERILPPFNRPGSAGVPHCLRTPLVDALREDPSQVDPAQTVPRVMAAILAGGGEEYLPFTGQSTALVHEVLPAGEIVRRMVKEAEAALAAAARAIGPRP